MTALEIFEDYTNEDEHSPNYARRSDMLNVDPTQITPHTEWGQELHPVETSTEEVKRSQSLLAQCGSQAQDKT